MEIRQLRPGSSSPDAKSSKALQYPLGRRPRENVPRLWGEALLKASLLPGLLVFDLYKSRSEFQRRTLITFFFAIFGSTMLIGADAWKHQWVVENHYPGLGFEQFLQELWLILSLREGPGGALDVYNHLISYLFGAVLDLPGLYIPFVATVYGYFFAGSVTHVLRNLKLSNTNYVVLCFAFVFLFIKGLDGVQTVRTWTGLWVLVYACLKYYERRQFRYLFLMFSPPFIHFGFFAMAIPAWVVLVFGSRPLLYSGLLIASTLTNFFPAATFSEIVAQTERGASSLHWYTVYEQADQGALFQQQLGQTIWYNAYNNSGLQRWAPTILVVALLGGGLYLRGMTTVQKRIMSTGVLTLAFSNMTWFVYALHNRTLTIATVFILAGFLMARLDPLTSANFRGPPVFYKIGLYLSLFLFAPWILFALSVTFDRLSLFGFVAPVLVWFDSGANISVKEFLNYLLGRG